MKSFMKKVIMSALALAIVMIGIVSRTEVVKAAVSDAWDDNGTWVFKIIPTMEEKLILTKTDVSGHKPNTAFCNAKLLYSYYYNNEPTEIFIGDNAFFSDVVEVKYVTTVTIETECLDREGFSNPAGILNIGDSAFENCPELTEFNCQRNVKIKIIGNTSFGACNKLKTIDLTEVENIGNAAFEGCEYLEKIKFNKVNSIGYRAFYNCRSLQEVDFGEWVEDTECNIAGNAFAGVGSVGGENNPVLILPDGWTGDEPDENGKWHGGYFRYIKSMSISDDTIVLTEEDSKQLTVETSPIESENKAVTWSSSDESVATVDENGKVTAVSAGNATITVTSTIDERKTVTCSVTVNHNFSASYTIDIAATCTEKGSKSIHCSGCSEKKNVTEIPALGHKYGDWKTVKEATVDGEGSKERVCAVCGNKDTETIPKIKKPDVTKKFGDVDEGKWYVPYIQDMVDRGLMSGTSSDTFEPNGTCTRAMFVQILYNAEGKPSVKGIKNPFKDVPKGKWYTNAVIWAYSNKVTAGTSKDTFGPDNKVSRQQIATLLYRYAKAQGFDVSKTKSLDSFKDKKQVASYSKDAIKWALGTGIMSGKSSEKLDPAGNATRAEVATMVSRYLDYYKL